jgi:hypothetical protein
MQAWISVEFRRGLDELRDWGCNSEKTGTDGSSTGALTVNMQEGDWEMSVDTKMSGLAGNPEVSLPISVKGCLTKEDIAGYFFALSHQMGCKPLSQKNEGNAYAWEGRCEEYGAVSEIKGEISYSGTTYAGKMIINAKQKDGQILKSAMTLSGRRLGECSPETRAKRDWLKKAEKNRKES